ncbi:unnamed protein product, partial [marine sediment metagenome]
MIPLSKDIEVPLLEALIEIGGEGKPRDIHPLVTKKFPQLTESDLTENLKSGYNKWISRIHWSRFTLTQKGEIDNSRFGIWAITDKGRKRVKPVEVLIEKKDKAIPGWNSIYSDATNSLEKISGFRTFFVTEKEFSEFLKPFGQHLLSYTSILMSGHFDNSLANIIADTKKDAHTCDVKVLSLQFSKDQRGKKNLKALKKMEKHGVEVK